jgi:hypothetical protein
MNQIIYRANGQNINRLQALSLFLTTCRLAEANVMLAARAWANGADKEDTAGGRQLRETVRRTSTVQIIADVEERTNFASPDFATIWALFTDERSVAISVFRAKGLEALAFGVAIIHVFRAWIDDNYAVTAAARDSWLTANQIALSAAITQLQAA